ncbi:DnaJ family domain-containing protein [Gordonia sp. NPDC003950]
MTERTDPPEGHFRRVRRWKPQRHEDRVEKTIREATERGDFDNLPGMGKPLNLSGLDDPDWWAKQKIRDEELDSTALLPPTLQLRKEADTFPESLRGISDEQAVRAILDDYNKRVKQDRLRPSLGPASHIVARTIDVDDMVARWRELR